MKFNKLIPELSVKDIHESKRFYIEILGFRLDYERIEDKFSFISLEGAQLMIEQRNGVWQTGELEYPYGRGVNFQIETENIELLLRNIKKHNIPLFRDIMINNYSGYTQKEFIVQDPDGYLGTAPVKSFPPNGYGLYNMAGNVWEWCSNWFDQSMKLSPKVDSQTPKAIRGGSYLCHSSYCNRYRVAARSFNTMDSSTGNMGFRCVRNA